MKGKDMSFSNLPSITGITFAGVIATGSHGTGLTNQVLAEMVNDIEFVNGQGELVYCNKEVLPDVFKAILCSLGAIGIITKMTL